MKLKSAVLALGFAFAAHGALALTTDEIIADLQAQGYSRVEVKVGPNQIKVEAIRGTEKVETIYDIATGAVLKTETDTVRLFDNTNPGVQIRERNRDFVRVVSRSGDDDGDHADGHISGRGRGASDDDSGDDHGGRSRGASDDDSDDDHGGRGRGSDDDAEDDDHGGGSRGSSHDDSSNDDSDDDSGDDSNDSSDDDSGDDSDDD